MTCVQNGSTNGYCPQWAYDASTNHITTTGCTYDAAGNMTADCSSLDNHTYQWDGEGRVASVDNGSTWTFTYDARGERVQLTSPSGTEYLAYDVAGNFIMAFGLANYDIVRWGGRMFSIYTPTGTDFNHVNNLSSTMMYTNQAGAPVEDMLFYPWGLVWESWGTGGYNYAGIPYRDLSTTTDLSAFRNLSPGLGRWLSPDPVGGDITNPQSLNLYPYVLNNPTTLIDPLGLQNCRPPAAQMGSGVCVGNVLQITSAVMGWGLVGGYSAWDEFGLLLLGTTPGSSGVTYNYQLQPTILGVTSSTIETGGPPDTWLTFYNWQFGWTYTLVGVTFNSSDPGIVFTPTGPTTATFVSSYPFYQTVGKFLASGLHAAPLDLLNRFHPGQLDLRNDSLICSMHVAVNWNSGGGPGVPTTGDVHLDTVNPYPSWSVAFGPGGFGLTALAHGVFDVFGGGLYPGSQACK